MPGKLRVRKNGIVYKQKVGTRVAVMLRENFVPDGCELRAMDGVTYVTDNVGKRHETGEVLILEATDKLCYCSAKDQLWKVVEEN